MQLLICNGYRPSSPYTLLFGVLTGTFKNLLQANVCTFSTFFKHCSPHISAPYSIIVLAQVAVEVLVVVAVIIHAVPRRAVPVCFSFRVLPVVTAALSTDVSSGRLSLVAMFPWWQSSVIHLHYLLVLEVEGECSFL